MSLVIDVAELQRTGEHLQANVSAALFNLADRLSDSVANDEPEGKNRVMSQVADLLRMIAVLADGENK